MSSYVLISRTRNLELRRVDCDVSQSSSRSAAAPRNRRHAPCGFPIVLPQSPATFLTLSVCQLIFIRPSKPPLYNRANMPLHCASLPYLDLALPYFAAFMRAIVSILVLVSVMPLLVPYLCVRQHMQRRSATYPQTTQHALYNSKHDIRGICVFMALSWSKTG